MPTSTPEGLTDNIAVYDNGGKTLDRYTVTFKTSDSNMFISMSEDPRHPCGVYSHDEDSKPIDEPTHDHIGKKIEFSDLPEPCQAIVIEDYKTLEASNAAFDNEQ